VLLSSKNLTKTILYIENNSDGTVGGSYYSLLYLVSGLDRNRYRPIVIFRQDNPLIPEFTNAGIETRVMPRPDALQLSSPGKASPGSAIVRAVAMVPIKLFNFCSLLIFPIFSHARFLRRHRVDLVHLNNSIERNNNWMLAAFLARVPCITHQRGSKPRYSLSARLLSRSLKAIVCISNAVRESLLSGGINHPRLEIIYNGLDPSMMVVETDRDGIRARHGIGQADQVIGIVGNLKPWKGQEVVLLAMAPLAKELPKLRCIMVGASGNGKDPFERHLRDMVIALGLEQQVIFTGYQKNVADYINAMDVLIHASVLPEPFGRVLLEGMALRKPVVASRAGGVPEIIIDGESGVLYAPGDHAQLAVEIMKILKNTDQAVALGEAGYQRLVKEFGIEKHISRVQQLYEIIFQEAGL